MASATNTTPSQRCWSAAPSSSGGSAVRTLAGAIIIGIIQVVLVLQGLRSEWQHLIAGLIVLGVIALQTQGTRDRRR